MTLPAVAMASQIYQRKEWRAIYAGRVHGGICPFAGKPTDFRLPRLTVGAVLQAAAVAGVQLWVLAKRVKVVDASSRQLVVLHSQRGRFVVAALT